jgi:hypothetical protein
MNSTQPPTALIRKSICSSTTCDGKSENPIDVSVVIRPSAGTIQAAAIPPGISMALLLPDETGSFSRSTGRAANRYRKGTK